MRTLDDAALIPARLAKLEREAKRWRIAAVVMTLLLGATALTAFQFQAAPSKPVDAESLTLHGARGTSVTLSLNASGELEAQFERGTSGPQVSRGGALVLLDADGRPVARLGPPVARQLRP